LRGLTSSIGVGDKVDDLIADIECQDVVILHTSALIYAAGCALLLERTPRMTDLEKRVDGRSVFVQQIGAPRGRSTVDTAIQRQRDVQPASSSQSWLTRTPQS
jgi:hypothetical protein